MKYVSPQTEKRKQQQKKRKKQMLIIALAAVLVVTVVAVVFVLGGRNKNKGDDVNMGSDTNVQTEITPEPEEIQPTEGGYRSKYHKRGNLILRDGKTKSRY